MINDDLMAQVMAIAEHPDAWPQADLRLSLIHISEPTRLLSISYAVFCLKKKKTKKLYKYNKQH